MINPLGPIAGVPEELTRSLNDRFRQINQATGAKATAGGRQTRLKDYPAEKQAAGDFFVDMDRGNALYQIQVGKWLLVSGQMAGALASRPTDLGVSDTGFLYRSTDTGQEFRWSGSAWAEVTPSNGAQLAVCSGNLTLSAVATDVTGCSLTLARSGKYIFDAVFDMALGVSDGGQIINGFLVVDGSTQSGGAVLSGAAGTRVTTARSWYLTGVVAGQIAKLRASITATVGGASLVRATNTTITAVWVGV